MEVLLQTYYIILPIIMTAVVGWVGFVLKDQKKKEEQRANEIKQEEIEAKRIRDANSTGIMLVLRYMLKRYHGEYMIQGKMTYTQYSDWQDLFGAYSELGGNSIAVEWNKEIEQLEKCDSISDVSPFEAMLRQSMEKEKHE